MGAARAQAEEFAAGRMTMGFPDSSGRLQRRHERRRGRDQGRTAVQAAGFEPFKVGGVAAVVRIEMPGDDPHQFGSNGELLDLDQARNAIDPKEVPA